MTETPEDAAAIDAVWSNAIVVAALRFALLDFEASGAVTPHEVDHVLARLEQVYLAKPQFLAHVRDTRRLVAEGRRKRFCSIGTTGTPGG
jgi:hypothetical protein